MAAACWLGPARMNEDAFAYFAAVFLPYDTTFRFTKPKLVVELIHTVI